MKYYAIRKGHHPQIIAKEWSEAEPLIRKEISKFRNPEWKGFSTLEGAEAYMAEVAADMPEPKADGTAAASPAPAHSESTLQEDALAEQFQFTADAVIFVDGSCNFKKDDFDGKKPNRTLTKPRNYYYSAYSFIIFYRDGSVYVESARLDDGKFTEPKDSNFSIIRHGFTMEPDGTVSSAEDTTDLISYVQHPSRKWPPQEFEGLYVLASWNIVSEVEGATQALSLCLERKGLKSAYVFYDCDKIDMIKSFAQGKKPQRSVNVTYNYGEFCKKLLRNDKHIGTAHVYSHDKGKQLGLNTDWRIELFNSCADMLAKAETYNNPIDAITENVPLAPYGLKPFKASLDALDAPSEAEIDQTIGQRRQYAFQLAQKVLADPNARPRFVQE